MKPLTKARCEGMEQLGRVWRRCRNEATRKVGGRQFCPAHADLAEAWTGKNGQAND